MQWLRFRKDDALVPLLEGVPIFAGLRRSHLREISTMLQRQTYAPGRKIFEQGQPGLGLYVLVSGEVEISQEDEDGSRPVLSRVKPGEFFGELALLDDAPRTATATAVEESELVVFFRTSLVTLSEQRPSVGVEVLMHLSRTRRTVLCRTPGSPPHTSRGHAVPRSDSSCRPARPGRSG